MWRNRIFKYRNRWLASGSHIWSTLVRYLVTVINGEEEIPDEEDLVLFVSELLSIYLHL